MRLRDMIILACFTVALFALGFYYQRKVSTLGRELKTTTEKLQSTEQQLGSTERQLQATTISLKVHQDQHARKDEELRRLRGENQDFRTRLGLLTPEEGGRLLKDMLVTNTMAMTTEQLTAYLGQPREVLGPRSEFWYYRNLKVLDPNDGKSYSTVQFMVQTGRVTRVTLLN